MNAKWCCWIKNHFRFNSSVTVCYYGKSFLYHYKIDFFLGFDFCRFCVVIRFFHPRHSEGFSIPDFIHYIYFPILILEKEPVFPFWMFSAKQGNYWYHLYNVFGMTLSLTGDWTWELEASTLPLGYRGGGAWYSLLSVWYRSQSTMGVHASHFIIRGFTPRRQLCAYTFHSLDNTHTNNVTWTLYYSMPA